VGAGQPQNAIVVGDADSTNPGNEVVVNWHETNVRGRLWVLSRRRSGWASELVFSAGEGTPWSLHHLHNLVIGDFDTAHPGPEIVMTWSPMTHNPGRISVFAKTGNRWEHHLIWQDLDEAHGIAFLTLIPQQNRRSWRWGIHARAYCSGFVRPGAVPRLPTGLPRAAYAMKRLQPPQRSRRARAVHRRSRILPRDVHCSRLLPPSAER